jgi:hypothetical protein
LGVQSSESEVQTDGRTITPELGSGWDLGSLNFIDQNLVIICTASLKNFQTQLRTANSIRIERHFTAQNFPYTVPADDDDRILYKPNCATNKHYHRSSEEVKK